ncbi:hypothetical protein [Paenibacillus sp. SAFN-117]|uniref:hypothetical protein n=1 Tax=Paenibacillus sp. SAFN-117 TaxID=3436860 RepID=UPI003F7F6767
MLLAIGLVSSSVFAEPVTNKPENLIEPDAVKELNFTNVYQYNEETYDKEIAFENLSLSITDDQAVDLNLKTDKETISLSQVPYIKQYNSTYGTTTLRGHSEINEDEFLSFMLVYDKPENANGNIVITKKVVSNNETLGVNDTPEITYEDTTIRFAKSIDLQQDIAMSLKKSRAEVQSDATISNGIDYNTVVNYKYGSNYYIGELWDQNYLVGNGGDNNMQIKVKPSGSLWNYTDPYGRRGTIIENQSGMSRFNFRFERTSGASMLIYPVFPNDKPTTVNISVSIRLFGGISLGASIPIALSGSNTTGDGNTARWDLNNIWVPFENSGETIDSFYIYGRIKGNVAPGTVTFSSGSHARFGCVYYFGDIPAQAINFAEDVPLSNFTANVR